MPNAKPATRVLIYGFGPYLQFDDNITEKIVRALPKRRGLKKIVFPVRFHKAQFTRALKDLRPEIVLGLGQCSSGKLLRQERRAINLRRSAKEKTLTPISRRSPAILFSNLPLNLGAHGKSSSDAGNYVCNFSMYVMLDYIRRRELPVLFGFIHVPAGYNIKAALGLLRQALNSSRFNVQRAKSLTPRLSRKQALPSPK